ncbi:MAG: hypothetical protein Q9159_001846 [Coniocarpon cinnabarinum]
MHEGQDQDCGVYQVIRCLVGQRLSSVHFKSLRVTPDQQKAITFAYEITLTLLLLWSVREVDISGLFGSGGGGFGSNSNTGGFGSNTNNNSTSLFGGNNNRPSFGASGSTTGQSLFGNNSNNNTGSGFGSGGGFGSNSNTGFGSSNTGSGGGSGGLFGNTSNNTSSGFGSSSNNTAGGGLFGGGNANNASSGFSGNTGGFGSGGFGANQAPGQNPGTGSVPNFAPYSEKEGTTTANFFSLGFQQPFSGWSFDELRMQDYDQGRKYGNQNGQGGAFGTSSGFGGTSTTNNAFGGGSNGFGSSTFGSTQNNTSGFNQQNSSGFGSGSTAGGLFGQQNKPSLFGASTTATSSQPSGGLFGTSNNTTSNTGGGLFGSSNAGGGFGTQNKTGFGTSGSTFGNNTNNSGNSLFGSGGGSGGFGQNPQNNTQNQSGGFGFGNNANNNSNTGKSLFGGGGGGGTNSSTSLFGGSTQNQQQGSNLFGQASNQSNTGSSLFGNKPAANNPFGNTGNNQPNTGSSLFGNTQAQPQQQNSGGLFGQSKPGGLFGNANNAGQGFGGSTFGSNFGQNNTSQPAAGNSLFGNTNQTQPQAGGSLFGNSQQQQQPQPMQQPQQLSASMLNAYPYGHEQLFADLGTPEKPVGPIATPLSSSQKARKPAPLPAWKINPSASMRLITPQKRPGASYGFSYSAYGTPSSAYSSPAYSGSLLGSSTNRTLNKSMSVGNMRNADDGLFRPDAFSPNLRPTSGRGSMKRLHIDRNLRTSFLSEELDNAGKSPLRKTVSFNNEATSDANNQSSTALVRRHESDLGQDERNGYLRASTRGAITNGETAAQEMQQVNGQTPDQSQNATPRDAPVDSPDHSKRASEARAKHDDQPAGTYWSLPTMEDLKSYSRDELRAITGLTVGRHGIGKIEFSTVNLQRTPLDKLFDHIVSLEMRSAAVYRDESTKPPPGKDLNVPATVSLENSWPRSQRGREKVFAQSGPALDRHLERLKRVPDTQFVSYEKANGTWTFRVQHFSTYQLDYETEALSSSVLSAPPDSLANSAMSHSQLPTDADDEDSPLSNGDASRGSGLDDTFAFRRSRKSMPGGFEAFDAEFTSGLKEADTMQSLDDPFVQSPKPRQPSLSEHQMQGNESMASNIPSNLDGPTDARASRPSTNNHQSLMPRSILKKTQRNRQSLVSPAKNLIDVAGDTWAEQLQRTLSPKKQDRQALRERQGQAFHSYSPATVSPIKPQAQEAPFVTSFDIMNSLFGKSGKGRKHASGAMKHQV